MLGCYLKVGGRSFNPDAFLARARFTNFEIWRVGEPVKRRRPGPSRVYENSGFTCDVGMSDGVLKDQIRDAQAFLVRHRDEFVALAADAAVEFADLELSYYCRLGSRAPGRGTRVLVVQGEYLPKSFLRLAGDLGVGVALSLYPNPNDHEDEDESL
ncbi:MAG TPA: hypothetical protein VGI81_16905 [Tepidisphaeraceae bacterium]|jgi:hypothetical protein